MGKYSQKEVSKESDYRTRFRDSMSKELDSYLDKIISNLRIDMILSLSNRDFSFPFVETKKDEFKFLMMGVKVIHPRPTILTNLQAP